MSKQKPVIKVGLIIDEFFGGAGTAFGGYGFLARRYVAKYIPDKDITVDVLMGRSKLLRQVSLWKNIWSITYGSFFARRWRVDDVSLYLLPGIPFFASQWLKRKNYSTYLSIELTNNYVLETEPNKHKKLILWIQDPRPKYEWKEIATVKLFPESSYYNQAIYDTVHRWSKEGRVKFITQGRFLNQKAFDLYRLPTDTPIQYLPNPVDIDYKFDINKFKKKDNIIFLGRIESVKRGWLFCEIAKRMPEYNFYILGQTFREKGKNSKIMDEYKNIPNLHFAGHVDGKVKEKYIKEAKILVNTSIHEALPVSFLEALAYGTLLVSNRNPEDLTSQFGVWVGDVLGDGFDKVDLYVNAIKSLMLNDKKRQKIAKKAIDYIKKVHNVDKFTVDLRKVIYEESETGTSQ